jgi:hypothetical protein
MISIKVITDSILMNCPHCKTGQFIEEWGTKKCRYEKCGKEFDVPYNPELLLLEAIKLRKSYDELLEQLGNVRSVKPKPSKLQKVLTGWILVPQGY